MSDLAANLSILGPALIAGLLVTLSHVPMGQQVLARGIVFIDLAIAQVAGLGVIAAHNFGIGGENGWSTQLSAAVAALLGALLLTWTERKRPEVQEALIGVLFVLASTAQILILANNPHGGEDLKDLLAGQILWVSTQQLVHAAIVTGIFLVAWFGFRERIGRIGFYVLFALVVTVSVQLVGVYLVFTSLIVPALATYRYPPRWQLLVGYGVAIASYVLGLALSAVMDLPSSPLVVWVMAVVGLLVHLCGRHGPAKGASLAACLAFLIAAVSATPARAEGFDVASAYEKAEYAIAMRDGTKLHTIVYTPKDKSRRYPILFRRTPYSIAPYGAGRFHEWRALAPAEAFLRDGYIFAIQDVRGRYKSEGQWDNYRLLREGRQGIDETTDAYDTIEWLVRNVKGNSGKVGQWGISHDGWFTVMGMLHPHPALKAASPQATTADAFFGDDFHHNGAFLLQILSWIKYMGDSNAARGDRAEMKLEPFDYGTPWGYEFYLNAGPTDRIDEKYFGGTLEKQWKETIEHPDYDEYWRRRNLLEPLVNIRVPVLNVAGWYDTFDAYGSLATYKAIESRNPRNANILAVGPWRHGGWLDDDGSKLGDVGFGSKTSEYFQQEVIYPFFRHYLKGEGDGAPAEAVMFETGNDVWHRLEQWPPKGATPRQLYFEAGHGLAFDRPPTQAAGDACDEYVSDPARPVPYTSHIEFSNGNTWRIDDQRLDSTRPDVLGYESGPLKEDVTLAGPVRVNLFASTSGTDSDWFVKLIDVYPGNDAVLPGYQRLIGMEVMRGRYRNSFSKPEAMKPGEITPIAFDILDKYHTFKKGHRIRVHVQSTFFPYVDRNPQTFVESIYRAQPQDYRKATQRVCHSAGFASHLVLPIVK